MGRNKHVAGDQHLTALSLWHERTESERMHVLARDIEANCLKKICILIEQ